MENLIKNPQGRIQYNIEKDQAVFLNENEYDYVKKIEKVGKAVWNQDFKESHFETLVKQNTFIKRMIKYGVFETDFPTQVFPSCTEIRIHSLNEPTKLHIQSGHNLELWIRDRWDKYSTETMEVVTVLGKADIPNQHRIFIAHNNVLHSYTIDGDTDKSVFDSLNEIENDLDL